MYEITKTVPIFWVLFRCNLTQVFACITNTAGVLEDKNVDVHENQRLGAPQEKIV